MTSVQPQCFSQVLGAMALKFFELLTRQFNVAFACSKSADTQPDSALLDHHAIARFLCPSNPV
jgi:hypothetical protein